MVHTEEVSVLYMYTKFEADSSICSKVIRGPKIWKLGHVTLQGHAHLGVVLWSVFRTQEGSSSLYTKFEADRSIRSKVIRGPKFGNPRKIGPKNSGFGN